MKWSPPRPTNLLTCCAGYLAILIALRQENDYISIVKSILMYCSPLWRPYLLKDINMLERVQRHATNFILSDYLSNYKARLIQLNMLPLMYTYEFVNIVFFLKSLNNPSERFNILNYVNFSTGPTRPAGTKLFHKTTSTSSIMNSYFYRLPKLWNSLPIIDLSQPLASLKLKLKKYFWNHF